MKYYLAHCNDFAKKALGPLSYFLVKNEKVIHPKRKVATPLHRPAGNQRIALKFDIFSGNWGSPS
jgi:hypothetical protein